MRFTDQSLIPVWEKVQAGARLSFDDGLVLMHSRWVLSGAGPDGQVTEQRGTSAEVLRRQPNGAWLYALDNPFVPVS